MFGKHPCPPSDLHAGPTSPTSQRTGADGTLISPTSNFTRPTVPFPLRATDTVHHRKAERQVRKAHSRVSALSIVRLAVQPHLKASTHSSSPPQPSPAERSHPRARLCPTIITQDFRGVSQTQIERRRKKPWQTPTSPSQAR